MERTRCEVYSRPVGYLRPKSQWNAGKQEEFKQRTEFVICSTETEQSAGTKESMKREQ